MCPIVCFHEDDLLVKIICNRLSSKYIQDEMGDLWVAKGATFLRFYECILKMDFDQTVQMLRLI